MGLVFDPVSYAVDEFILRRGQVVVDAAIRTAFGLSDRILTFGLEAPPLNRETLTLTLERVHSSVIDICSRNSFGILLLLFRKVRHEFIVSLFKRGTRSCHTTFLH